MSSKVCLKDDEYSLMNKRKNKQVSMIDDEVKEKKKKLDLKKVFVNLKLKKKNKRK
jgi:hypothetical protein